MRRPGGASSTGASLVCGLALAMSCSPAPRQAEGLPQGGNPPASETSQQRIQRLEREARALARGDGCATVGGCRAAPVGDRPCGGPRTYVVYCALTTDSVALYRKLDELARAERAYNQEQGLASTCEFRMPPPLMASGGSCRAATTDAPR
jgi:hypothetical protein